MAHIPYLIHANAWEKMPTQPPKTQTAEFQAARPLLEKIVSFLEQRNVDEERLQATIVPVKTECQHLIDHQAEAFWMTPTETSIDVLIDIQAKGKVSQFATNLRAARRHGGRVVGKLALATSLYQSVAVLAAAAVAPLLYGRAQDFPGTPYAADRDRAEELLLPLLEFAFEEGAQSSRFLLYDDDFDLPKTPFVTETIRSTAFSDQVLEHLASRIAYLINTYHPVVLNYVDEAPSPTIDILIKEIRAPIEAAKKAAIEARKIEQGKEKEAAAAKVRKKVEALSEKWQSIVRPNSRSLHCTPVDTVISLANNMPLTALAIEFGISDVALRKHLKKNGWVSPRTKKQPKRTAVA